MAQRDRSQGFGFMYVDISRLLQEKAKLEKDNDKPVLTENTKTANFNKDSDVKPAAKVYDLKTTDKTVAIKQIKENLDRLQSLHHKLHAMLEEIDKSSKGGNDT